MVTDASQGLQTLAPGLPRRGEVLRLDCRQQTGGDGTTTAVHGRQGLRVVTVRLQSSRTTCEQHVQLPPDRPS